MPKADLILAFGGAVSGLPCWAIHITKKKLKGVFTLSHSEVLSN